MLKMVNGITMTEERIEKAHEIAKALDRIHTIEIDSWVKLYAEAKKISDKQYWSAMIYGYLRSLKNLEVISFDDYILLDEYYCEMKIQLKNDPNDVIVVY